MERTGSVLFVLVQPLENSHGAGTRPSSLGEQMHYCRLFFACPECGALWSHGKFCRDILVWHRAAFQTELVLYLACSDFIISLNV